jgi:hypothetical protein
MASATATLNLDITVLILGNPAAVRIAFNASAAAAYLNQPHS